MPIQCDFCRGAPAWRYPADDFEFGVHLSVGGWLACDACHRLIEADDSAGLADRSLAASGLSGEPTLAVLRDLHLAFWSHRTGPPEAVQRKPSL